MLESHPLQPFLPQGAKILMLGSFPPPRKRWSMDFFYPNLNNDMWRIFGIVFFGDKNYFLNAAQKAFDKEKIAAFLCEKGIALFDTASVVRRLNDNAADKFLEIVEPANIASLLAQIPDCRNVCVTGQKAADAFLQQFSADEPKVGESAVFQYNNREFKFFRMPSSSRAYPLALAKKAEIYGKMFEQVF
jgi:G:T/U-mismatch repair DNA glycosylase